MCACVCSATFYNIEVLSVVLLCRGVQNVLWARCGLADLELAPDEEPILTKTFRLPWEHSNSCPTEDPQIAVHTKIKLKYSVNVPFNQ